MPTTKFLLLLTLLALFGVSSAQSCGTGTYTISNSEVQGLLGTGIGLAALALTVSFDVVAIGYIIGKLFPATGVLSWIRSEYWEIAKSAMIIASIYAIIVLAGELAAPFVSSSASSASPISTLVNGAQSYLCTASTTISHSFDYLSGMSIGMGFWKGTKVGTYLSLPDLPTITFDFVFGFVFSPYSNQLMESNYAAIGTWQSMLNDVITMMMLPVALILIFQMNLLFAIVTVGLALIIPIGLILRAFPFIRGVGGTLIAIGIGIAIIYPATLALFNAPVSNLVQNGLSWPTLAPPKYSTAPVWITLFKDTVGYTEWRIVSSSTGEFSGYAQSGYVDGINSFDSIYPAMNGIVNNSIYVILQFVLFVVDIMIIYPLVDSLAGLLGGTIRLQLGGKLKLV